ncbi:MAG: fibronectin type III-like domain-contianing protein, partial [Treponema sp.]|nr:fibronectin type III-like domain-contianing protein [Treponema sp.]
KAILESYLGGQAVGIAQIELLFGRANPCGKLAESFPIQLEDNPSYLNYPGNGKVANYAEGIFVGYRYYDKKNMKVLFPFGHGLSYTSFEYSALKLGAKKIKGGQSLQVSLKVQNTGKKAGKEIVQIYVAPPEGNECLPPYREARPQKELKGFEKVELKPGEKKTVTVTLDSRAFAVWDVELHDWYIPGGEYQIIAASSSRDVRLCANVEVECVQDLPFVATQNTVFEEIMDNPKAFAIAKTFARGPLAASAQKEEKRGKSARESISDEMQLGMMKSLPLRAMRSFDHVSQEAVDKMVAALNQAQK